MFSCLSLFTKLIESLSTYSSQTLPKVASHPAYQNSIIKKIHRAVFEILTLKAQIKGVFSKSLCCYGNL